MNLFQARLIAGYVSVAATLFAMASVVLGQNRTGDSQPQRPGMLAREWPAFRRDAGLTGFSPLVGGLATAPSVLWTHDLGGQDVATEQVRLVDLNGDGSEELLRILPDRLVCQSVQGDKLWESGPLARPQVVQIRDFAGDGTRGLLVATSTGVEHGRYLVNGSTGTAAFLYGCKNVFGRYERFGKLLADVPGEQLCAWWSGDNEQRFGGNAARGVGYLWSFEEGVDTPRLRFHVEEEGTIYAPLHLLADMDLDGDTDMVMISHEAMWVYDLPSGKRLMHARWGPQIRTYWAATAALPLAEGELPSLLMINPMIPGVQVVTQDGQTARSKWKRVVGDLENQYQRRVTIDRAAPDPFVDLDGDGEIEILTAITNEHHDSEQHLVIFRANDGARAYDQAAQTVITVDDLDQAGPPEILIRERNSLRICNWTGETFVDRWRGDGVTPLVRPAPAAGHLARAVGARSSSVNMPLWRERPGGRSFLLRFADGVWSCRLSGDSLERIRQLERHPALGGDPPPRAFSWDGSQLTVGSGAAKRRTYQAPRRQSYVAHPPLVGLLGGGLRIVVRESSGNLVSLSVDGSDRVVLLDDSPRSLGVCITDLDGDGQNEVLAPRKDPQGKVDIVALAADGGQKFRIRPPPGVTETALGPTGRLGPGRGRWFVVRYRIAYQNTRVAAYEGAGGELLWTRDFLGPQQMPATTFVLHLPTAVHDLNADGADDLLASSENWYEVISVKDNRSLTTTSTITAAVPGHWGAYATPIVADLFGSRQPVVFHNNAYALTLLTQLDGSPIWHYGLTRDTTHANQAGLADLDGDGQIEVVTAQSDGLLRAFSASASLRLCPSCPPDQQLTAANRSGRVLWTHQLSPPISDFATLDLDGDGRTELLCGASERLYALTANESRCRTLWDVALGAQVGAPVVADLDGDRQPELLISTADGHLHCLGRGGAKPRHRDDSGD